MGIFESLNVQGLVVSFFSVTTLGSFCFVPESVLTNKSSSSRGAVHKNESLTFLTEPPQVIGMSATLTNISDLAKFLNADVYSSDFRPVSINYLYLSVLAVVCFRLLILESLTL